MAYLLMFQSVIHGNMENSSLEVNELTDVLFDPQGPAKIGLELEVVDNDVAVETQVRDLFEFLLNILIIGIIKLRLHLCVENVQNESVENALQHYFDRININVYLSIVQDTLAIDPYCQIHHNDVKNTFSLSILRNAGNITHVEDLCAIYDLGSSKLVQISFAFK